MEFPEVVQLSVKVYRIAHLEIEISNNRIRENGHEFQTVTIDDCMITTIEARELGEVLLSEIKQEYRQWEQSEDTEYKKNLTSWIKGK